MGTKEKKRRGDRKDGYLVRNLDSLHTFMPFLLPDRADNEAVLNEKFDLTAVTEYLAKKNSAGPDFRYTYFHFICAALAKTIALRPGMNRFISGYRLYERKDIIFSFIVKKQFSDESAEAIANITIDRDTDVPPVEQIHDKLRSIVYSVREEGKTDDSTQKADILAKLPRFCLRIVMKVLRLLEYYGRVPDSLTKADPYHSSVFISNLGSIKMSASYHHLANWGTNSFFVVISERRKMPFYNEDGTVSVRDGIELGMTIDERIADGYYFAGSLKLFRRFFEEPELLDRPIMEQPCISRKTDEI